MAADLIGLLRSRGLQPVYQAATHGGEHACPCPLCGGRDRFRIWPGQEGGPACSRAGVPGTWYCRQCGRGAPLRLRVRRSDEDAAAWGDKYMVVEGSAMPALLAGEDPRAVVVVEAELDALAVAFAAGDLVTACAVLTNAGRPDAAAHALLSRALRILVALDFDEAGARGWSWWKATYPQARRWPVPEGKDPGDAVRLGCDLREWILAGLPPALTLGASDSGQRVQEQAGPDTPRDPDDVVIGVDVILSPEVQRLVDRVKELREILGSGPLRIDKRGRQTRLLAPEDWKREHREEYLRAWELVYVVSETAGYIATHPDTVLTRRNF